MQTTIETPAGPIDGYLAQPQADVSAAPPWPAVVVIHDALGLGQDIRTITERFASSGYLALAPNLYTHGGTVRCLRSVFQSLLRGSGKPFDDIEAARATLAGRPDCTGRVGVVGYCMGGGFALLTATRKPAEGEGFAASAPFYGLLPKDLSVLDDACPVVASFGGRDRSLRGAAETLDRELTTRGIAHDVKEYPAAGHSFANQLPLGPLNALARVAGVGYHHESNEDSWRRVQSFFAEHLR